MRSAAAATVPALGPKRVVIVNPLASPRVRAIRPFRRPGGPGFSGRRSSVILPGRSARDARRRISGHPMIVCGHQSFPIADCQKPAQATWKRRIRPPGRSSSCSISIIVIGFSHPSHERPLPRPAPSLSGLPAGNTRRTTLSAMSCESDDCGTAATPWLVRAASQRHRGPDAGCVNPRARVEASGS